MKLEQELKRIRASPNFTLQQKTREDVQRFIDFVERRIPPPAPLSEETDLEASPHPNRDPPIEAMSRLVEIERALETQMEKMKQSSQLTLTVETLNDVTSAIDHLEKLQASTEPPLGPSTEPRDIRAAQETLHSEIRHIIFLATKMMTEPDSKGKSEQILKEAAHDCQLLVQSEYSHLTIDSLTSALEGLITIAEKGDCLAALATRDAFIRTLLNSIPNHTTDITVDQLIDMFSMLHTAGPVLRSLAVFDAELVHLMNVLMHCAVALLPKMEFRDIKIVFHTMRGMGFGNAFPFLQELNETLMHEQKRFHGSDAAWLLIYLSRSQFNIRKAADHILTDESFEFRRLSLDGIGHLFVEIAKSVPPNAGQYFPKFVQQIVKRQNSLTQRSATLILKGMANAAYHPGETVLDILADHISDAGATKIFSGTGWSYARNCASLNYKSTQLLTAAKGDYLENAELYSVQSIGTLLFSLCLLDGLDDAILDKARARIQEEDLETLPFRVLTPLARSDLYCTVVLQKAGLFSATQRETCATQLRAALSTSRSRERYTNNFIATLQETGYTYKGEVEIREGLMLSALEKDGQSFSIEFASAKQCAYGVKPLLTTVQEWRSRILDALGYGIVRLSRYIYELTKEEQKDYIQSMASQPGEPRRIFPERFLKASQGLESISVEDTASEEDVFDEELVGGAEYYEET